MARILRMSLENHKVQFPKLSFFVGQKSILYHYCIQNVKDGSQIREYKINKERATNFSQSITVKVKKILLKSQDQFREKLKNRGPGKMVFLIKKV